MYVYVYVCSDGPRTNAWWQVLLSASGGVKPMLDALEGLLGGALAEMSSGSAKAK